MKINKIIVLFTIGVLTFIIAGCVGGCNPPQPPSYMPPPRNTPESSIRYTSVHVDVSDEAHGSIQVRMPGEEKWEGISFEGDFYGAPQMIEVFAIPEEGYIFDGWYSSGGRLFSREAAFHFDPYEVSRLIARFRNEADDPASPVTLGGQTFSKYSVHISLERQNIRNVSVLAELASLEVLHLSDNAISDLSALRELTTLSELGLSGNTITDISVLEGLVNLEVLWLGYNNITDINALSYMVELTTLWLNSNSISDISALSGLINLEDLRLSDNLISDISALSGLVNLERLTISENSISDISMLRFPNMTFLQIRDNNISDISALSGFSALTSLVLDNNSISDVSALKGLTNLRRLYLEGNPLTEHQIDELRKALPECEIFF